MSGCGNDADASPCVSCELWSWLQVDREDALAAIADAQQRGDRRAEYCAGDRLTFAEDSIAILERGASA